MKILKQLTFIILFSGLISSCNSLRTAAFDQYSYQKAIEIKIDSKNLIGKATTPYSDHLQEIGNLALEIEKIKEYEKNKINNEITYTMWKILTDKNKNLLVGFFKRWKDKKTLSPVFVSEAQKQIMETLDLLIQYEAKKDKESKGKLLDLISNN